MKKAIQILAAVIVGLVTTQAFAQSTTFTYQGRLNDGTGAANGTYDLRFTIYDAAGAGTIVGGSITNTAVGVTNGLFAVTLDFGASVFTGANRWIEIGVRTNGSVTFITLTPRQPVTPTPYAVRAANATTATTAASANSVAATNITGTIPPGNIGAGTITGTMLATGSVSSVHLAAGSITTAKLADGAVTTSKMQTLFNAPLEYTTFDLDSSIDFGASHQFGYNVLWIPNGNGYVITDPFSETIGGNGIADRGAVYLLLNGLFRTITSPFPQANGRFGESIADTGSGLLVGAPGEGHVYSVAYDGTTSLAYLGSSSDQFGKSVARTGNGINLIGSPTSSGGPVFAYSGSSPKAINPPFPISYFGQSMVAMGTNQVLIGALSCAFLYSVGINGGVHVTTFFPIVGNGPLFGESLATFGADRVLVGGSGPAVLYNTNGTMLASFTDPENGPASDGFGTSVAALGTDKIAVSAPWRTVDGKTNAGVVYIFNTNGLWIGISPNPAPSTNAFFGMKLFGLGDDLFAANTLERSTGFRRGAVRWCRLKPNYKYLPGLSLDPGQELTYLGMAGASTLEFGAGNDKEMNAGKIGYQTFSSDALDIVGAGTNSDRRVRFFAEGGTIFDGPVTATSFSGAASNLTALDANQLSSGTVNDVRLSTNVARRTGGNTFNGIQIVTNGIVGIGTPNPAVPLQVEGAATWPGGGSPSRGAITGIQTAGDAFSAGVAGISLVPGAYGVVGESHTVLPNVSGPGAANIGVGGNSSTTNGTGVYGNASAPSGMTFGVVGDAPSAQGYAGYFRGRGYFSTNVGIATTSPGRLLQVGGPPGSEGMIRLQSTSTNGAAFRTWDIGVPKDDVNVAGKFYSFVIDDAQLGTEPEFLIQYFTGNVGIGTTNPLAKLDVNGNVRATSFEGNGGNLTSLNASTLLNGTIGDARLSTNVALRTGSNVFSGDQFFATGTRIVMGGVTNPSGRIDIRTDGRALRVRPATGTFGSFAEFVDGASVVDGIIGTDGINVFGGTNQFVIGTLSSNAMTFGTAGFYRMTIDAAGRVGIGNNNPTNLLMVANARCDGSSWINASDRNLKQDFAAVDPQAVLDKVAALPVQSWSYKAQPDQKHVGPVAQDFRAAFGLGQDDTSIATVDADGVALVAIQGLNRKVEQKEAEITELKRRLEKLEALLNQKLNGGAK